MSRRQMPKFALAEDMLLPRARGNPPVDHDAAKAAFEKLLPRLAQHSMAER
ncbi:hypothetical protein [Polyangium fumosum]|uniref:hypothetical protein n=1 Tax=Polyangium fumosum TaxID=889272 RepID=UPI00147941CE|nr:hypothetical protein [Polyangium fumosum]